MKSRLGAKRALIAELINDPALFFPSLLFMGFYQTIDALDAGNNVVLFKLTCSYISVQFRHLIVFCLVQSGKSHK